MSTPPMVITSAGEDALLVVDAFSVEVGPVCRAEILYVIVPVAQLYLKVAARSLRRGVDKVAVLAAAEYPRGLAACRLVHRNIHRRVAEVVYKIKKSLELISCHCHTSSVCFKYINNNGIKQE